MIRKIGQAFVLDTAHTTYAFSILPGGHPEHLYYGRTIHIEHPDDLEILVEKHVFAPGNVNICAKRACRFFAGGCAAGNVFVRKGRYP